MRDRLSASIDEFLSDEDRLHEVARVVYRGELAVLERLLLSSGVSAAEQAVRLVADVGRGRPPSTETEHRLLRLDEFLEWLTGHGADDLAEGAATLRPAFHSEVRTYLGLTSWDPWPAHERLHGASITIDAGARFDAPVSDGAEGLTGGRWSHGDDATIEPDIGDTIGRSTGGLHHFDGDRVAGDRAFGGDDVAAVGGAHAGDRSSPLRARVGRVQLPKARGERRRRPAAPRSATSTARAEPAGAVAARLDARAGAEEPHRAFGALMAPDVATVGKRFEIQVGLAPDRPEGVAGGDMELPTLRIKPYVIKVQLVADSFDLDERESFRNELAVSTATPYPMVTLHLTPRSQRARRVTRTIHASFGLRGETVGVAIRTIDVYKPGLAPRTRRSEPALSGMTSSAPRTDKPADLTLEIYLTDQPNFLRWNVRSTVKGIRFAGDSTVRQQINGSARDFAAEIRHAVERTDGSVQLGQTLVGAGLDIGMAVPEPVWDIIRRAQAKQEGPLDILILSQEPYVPWELAIPAEPIRSNRPRRFLGAEANVGRWLLGAPPPSADPPSRVAATSMGVIQGRYIGPNYEELQGANDEVKRLARAYKAEKIAPDPARIRDVLNGRPPLDVIHFAVHGAVDTAGGDDGLILAEGDEGDPPITLGPLQVRGGRNDGRAPFVFLNACQVGEARHSLAAYGGLAAAFLRWGAAGVVAPIWAIDDEVSHQVALDLYARAFETDEGPPIASLLRETRGRFDPEADSPPATFLAYQLYGHPSMRLQRAAPDHG